MRDAQAIKEQVRQATDIVQLVERHVVLRKAGTNYKGLCPFHREKTPSFTVSPAKQLFRCYGCGAGGDVFSFVQQWEKVDFREALALLAEQAGIPLNPMRKRDAGAPTRHDLARVTQWAAGAFRQWLLEPAVGQQARAYIARRGIVDVVAERFRLGFAPDRFDGLEKHSRQERISRDLMLASGLLKVSERGREYDTFRNRVMFPIIDTMDRVIGFGGRTLGDDPAKYLNSPESLLFDKGRSLYGLHLARTAISEKGRVVVVEGYTDCVMAHQFGFAETVATMGTALTEAHVRLLKRYADRVILVFDSDEAGQRASERALAATCTQQLDVRLACVPEGKDPCDFLLAAGAEAFAAVLDGAKDALTYKWGLVSQRHGGAISDRQRREALDEYLALVASAAASGAVDEIGRGLLVNQVAKVLSLPPEAVLRALAGRARGQAGRPPGEAAGGAGRRNALDGSRWAPPADAEQAALGELLEVLLNEASYYEGISTLFDPSAFADPTLERVAGAVVDMIKTNAACDLAVFVSRFDDPSDKERIIELQLRGERKGNFAERVEGAVKNLQQVAARRRAQQSARAATGEGAGESDAALLALQAQARQSRGFAPRKALPGR